MTRRAVRRRTSRGASTPSAQPAESGRETTVGTLEEFILAIQPDGSTKRWYRGIGDSSRKLVPRLFRHPSIADVDELIAIEYELLTAFKQRSMIFDHRESRDNWDYLFLMQHVGVPTRLLDWTESPLMALHFALRSASEHGSDAAVWILDPAGWNQGALSHIGFKRGPLSVGDSLDSDLIDTYEPKRDFARMNKFAVALYGRHSNARIVAQRGVFVVCGRDSLALEDSDPANSKNLTRITVPSDAVTSLSGALRALGITASVAFPDLDGLATELSIEYGF